MRTVRTIALKSKVKTQNNGILKKRAIVETKVVLEGTPHGTTPYRSTVRDGEEFCVL